MHSTKTAHGDGVCIARSGTCSLINALHPCLVGTAQYQVGVSLASGTPSTAVPHRYASFPLMHSDVVPHKTRVCDGALSEPTATPPPCHFLLSSSRRPRCPNGPSLEPSTTPPIAWTPILPNQDPQPPYPQRQSLSQGGCSMPLEKAISLSSSRHCQPAYLRI